MGEITLELGDDQQPPHTCPGCGDLAYSSYGYLYLDGDAHAVYFARWTDHPGAQPTVTLLISLGEWGTDEPRPGVRASMALRAWVLDGSVAYTVLDAGETQWARHEALGTMLSREQALADPDKDEFFHLAEHVTSDDAAIREFLAPDRPHE